MNSIFTTSNIAFAIIDDAGRLMGHDGTFSDDNADFATFETYEQAEDECPFGAEIIDTDEIAEFQHAAAARNREWDAELNALAAELAA